MRHGCTALLIATCVLREGKYNLRPFVWLVQDVVGISLQTGTNQRERARSLQLKIAPFTTVTAEASTALTHLGTSPLPC